MFPHKMMRVDIKLPANNKKKRHLRVRMYMGGLHKAKQDKRNDARILWRIY